MSSSQEEEMKTLRLKFQRHRLGAINRRIPFFLTFDEWMKIWMDSGFFPQRGRKGYQYCMARRGDKGPYVVGNVRICTQAENYTEFATSKEGRDILRLAQNKKVMRWF